ncbi:hypothetical protein [Kaarinaea lacus]
MTADCIIYHINNDDKIVHLSENWQAFANNNMVGILSAENVLNKSVFDFIADENTRQLYKMLFNRVRSERVSVQLPFRCDSPVKRRYMSMEISPLDDSLIVLKSCVLREKIREAVLLLDPDIERTDDYLTICGWCKKVKVNDGWVEVESAMKLLNLVGESRLPNLSHAICDDCHESLQRELSSANKTH